ncbi:MAG: T9SS type A sorting domain-containing protein [Sphingobacteriales bacterium]|nr:MAG: T9SS type A sorting domain-containing protein [Sphingobacteriales bacterium]
MSTDSIRLSLLDAYPVPTSGTLTFRYKVRTTPSQKLRLYIYSTAGLIEYRCETLASDSSVIADLSNAPAGLYNCVLTDGKNLSNTVKVIRK